jgi:hypothetical protein
MIEENVDAAFERAETFHNRDIISLMTVATPVSRKDMALWRSN